MKKGTMMVLSALLMSCFLAVPAEAKSIGKDTYRVCKNDIFIDYDQLNCKKIVTGIKDDGSFTAVDLGEWLEEQDIYDSEEISYIDFQGLVYAAMSSAFCILRIDFGTEFFVKIIYYQLLNINF